mgnify:CR=1 FL=1
MLILKTQRLLLRRMNLDDGDFIFELLNGKKWKQFVGDRGIDTIESARAYLQKRVLPDYDALGFGFYIIERRDDHTRVGNCGLTLRLGMEHPDIGYSLLERYEGKGYAFEAAEAILDYGFRVHNLKHIEAIVSGENQRSIHLLKKLGMHYKNQINLPDDGEELMLFGINPPQKENPK